MRETQWPLLISPRPRHFIAEVTAVGGTVPEELTNPLKLVDQVRSTPEAPNPAAELVDAAVRGEVDTPEALAKLVSDAAKAELEAGYWKRLAASIAEQAMRRFGIELRDHGADSVLSSLNPQLEKLGQQIAELREVVDPVDWSPQRIIAEGSPEQLASWQKFPFVVAQADRILGIVAAFGPNGQLPIIEEPGVGAPLRGLRYEAMFLVDVDPWAASDRIRARVADWRTSPALTLPLRLGSLADARERLRVLAEADWAANNPTAGRGRLDPDVGFIQERRKNPYSIEPAVA